MQSDSISDSNITLNSATLSSTSIDHNETNSNSNLLSELTRIEGPTSLAPTITPSSNETDVVRGDEQNIHSSDGQNSKDLKQIELETKDKQSEPAKSNQQTNSSNNNLELLSDGKSNNLDQATNEHEDEESSNAKEEEKVESAEGNGESAIPQVVSGRKRGRSSVSSVKNEDQVTRSGRQTKTPVTYTISYIELPKTPSLESGTGTPLGQIPNVCHRIDKFKSSSSELKRFYSLCFPNQKGTAKRHLLKSHLKQFSGLVNETQLKSVKGKLTRILKDENDEFLIKLCLLMDIDFNKDDSNTVIDSIISFLSHPESTGRPFQHAPPAKNKKRISRKIRKPGPKAKIKTAMRKKIFNNSSSSSSEDSDTGSSDESSDSESDNSNVSRSDSGKEDSNEDEEQQPKIRKKQSTSSPPHVNSRKRKTSLPSSSKMKKKFSTSSPVRKRKRKSAGDLRTANSFVVFSSAKRDDVRAEYPHLTVQQITSKLGEMWKSLDPTEKEVYEMAATKLRMEARADDQIKGINRQPHKKKSKKLNKNLKHKNNQTNSTSRKTKAGSTTDDTNEDDDDNDNEDGDSDNNNKNVDDDDVRMNEME